MTLTSWRKVYWSRASLNSFSLLAKRLMTSSTVIPFGSDLSRAPSCARATWGSMMIGSSALNNAARERSNGNVNRAGRDWSLMNLILTKREHKKINGSLHPQSRRANGLFGGGGRLQFCLFHWMRQASEGLQDLLFFTFGRIPHGLRHYPLDQSWKQLVQLYGWNHGPGYDHLTLLFAIAAIGRLCYSLSRDAAHGLRTDVALTVGHHVCAEFGAHITGTDGKHVDVIAFQFKSGAFADRIHGELAGRVQGHERHRNVSGNARDVDDCPATFFAHCWRHCLDAVDGAEEIGFEQFAQCGRLHIGDRVADANARVIDPHIDAIKMVQREGKRAADVFAIANVAGEGERAVGVAHAVTGGLGATRIARQQHDARAFVGKDFGNRFPNSHGSAGHDHDFPCHFHGDPCIAWSGGKSNSQPSAVSHQPSGKPNRCSVVPDG